MSGPGRRLKAAHEKSADTETLGGRGAGWYKGTGGGSRKRGERCGVDSSPVPFRKKRFSMQSIVGPSRPTVSNSHAGQ